MAREFGKKRGGLLCADHDESLTPRAKQGTHFPMKFVFLGPPGAGKGTLAALVSEEYSIPHISTGDFFREAISQKTAFGTAGQKRHWKGWPCVRRSYT